MMAGALVLPPGIVGMAAQSTTRSPATPRTRSASSSTACAPLPIAQLLVGCIAVPTMQAKIACQRSGLGHGFLPRACIEAELARGSLVALATEEERPPESFWLAWKTGAEGRALQWWRDRLQRPLVPALLPRAG